MIHFRATPNRPSHELQVVESKEWCCLRKFETLRGQPRAPNFALCKPGEDPESQPTRLIPVITYGLLSLPPLRFIKQNP